MIVWDARGYPPAPAALAAAAVALRAGLVVGIPTDTVYGLAIDATRSGATDRVFAAKGRPRSVELPVLVADQGQAGMLVDDLPDLARDLMASFWPGALTLVLNRRAGLDLDLGDNLHSIGLRCPDHSVARTLCRAVGPLATTSANRHGEAPFHDAAGVAQLGGVAGVVDGGRCDGAPSTVVDCRGADPVLLRAGAIAWELIR